MNDQPRDGVPPHEKARIAAAAGVAVIVLGSGVAVSAIFGYEPIRKGIPTVLQLSPTPAPAESVAPKADPAKQGGGSKPNPDVAPVVAPQGTSTPGPRSSAPGPATRPPTTKSPSTKTPTTKPPTTKPPTTKPPTSNPPTTPPPVTDPPVDPPTTPPVTDPPIDPPTTPAVTGTG